MTTDVDGKPRDVRRRNAKLAFHPRARCALHRLPFVGRKRSDVRFWDVSSTGGYAGGTLTGEALARIFLKTLHDNPSTDAARAWLGWICSAWLYRSVELASVAHEHSPDGAFSALRGQVTGFAAALSDVLRTAVAAPDCPIAGLDADLALAEANAGLAQATARDAILRAAATRAPHTGTMKKRLPSA